MVHSDASPLKGGRTLDSMDDGDAELEDFGMSAELGAAPRAMLPADVRPMSARMRSRYQDASIDIDQSNDDSLHPIWRPLGPDPQVCATLSAP